MLVDINENRDTGVQGRLGGKVNARRKRGKRRRRKRSRSCRKKGRTERRNFP